MMKHWGNKAVVTLLFLLCFCFSKAQSFRYQSLTDKVQQTGFYSIPVTSELSAHLQLNFSDLRMLDDKGKQVPYIIRGRKAAWQRGLFQPFPIVANGLDDSGRSVIVIRKNTSTTISDLFFVIKNAAVSRNASLSGSNDGKQWFIISDGLVINDSYETGADSSIQSVSFPPSAYPFYRLTINNEKSDPFNILQIGAYNAKKQIIAKQYVANPTPAFVQTDSSDGYSYLKVTQQQPYPISSVGFGNIGQKYFTRTVRLMVPSDAPAKRRNTLTEWASFVLSTDALKAKPVPAFKNKEFWLVLYNGDNPPIKIDSITTSRDYHEIVAYLEAGKQYKLMMDATNAATPTYDLQQFQDSIPTTVSQLKLQPITAVASAANTPEKEAGFPRKYIWLIMVGVVALLSLLTWKLTTEMRKNI